MTRIQTAVSGGFDAATGDEILAAIQALMRSQEMLTQPDEVDWRMAPVADVRDATLARFAAGRFRSTFRSIRPLLQDESEIKGPVGERPAPPPALLPSVRTRAELDDDARAYALGLVHAWVQDPSNVRLLRIGLDLWPDAEVLGHVIALLRPLVDSAAPGPASRVAWFCVSELFRAGATETGFVPDGEFLPASVNLEAYRALLGQEAVRITQRPQRLLPWYVRQQALLFLATFDPGAAPKGSGASTETRLYRDLILFLRGEGAGLSDFSTLAVLGRRAFVDRDRAIGFTQTGLKPSHSHEIVDKDPAFALELIEADDRFADSLSARARADLRGSGARGRLGELEVLADVVRAEHPTGPLRNELSLLRFARAFLQDWRKRRPAPDAITPAFVRLKRRDDRGVFHKWRRYA